MTIFTSNLNEKKEDEDFIPPEVVDYLKPPLVAVKPPDVVVDRRRRRMGSLHVCIALIILPLGLCLLTGCIWLYKRLNDRVLYEEPHFFGRCGVNFHQLHRFDSLLPLSGHFESEFEITKSYEMISFPPFSNISGSTTMHDFEKNITLIADQARNVCYALPLNWNHVFRPQNFWEALRNFKKIKMSAEINMEHYKLITPALTEKEKEEGGELMAKHCAGLDTYRMVPEVRKKKKERKKKKILMMRVIRVNKSATKKRSACSLQGLHYCESINQHHRLYCFTIDNCP